MKTQNASKLANKFWLFLVVVVTLLLGACSQAPSPTATPEKTLESQAVLPGAEGLLYYIVHNPNAVKPYSVVRYDQNNDTKTTLYRSACEIQSVAGTLYWKDLRKVFVSMREPGNCSSDFEIFRITSLTTAEQLTTNTVDDTNVSVTLGDALCTGHSCFDVNYTLVWESQRFCLLAPSKRTIQLRTKSGSTFTDSSVSSCGSDLTQPSISGNGKYIAFVRKSGNTRSVELYKVATQSFSTIASTGGGLSLTNYFDPSPSDDGKKVVYLFRTNTFPPSSSIRLYNNGAISSIVSGATFSHPHLTADGKWLTYAQQVSGTYRIKTRNLLTNLDIDSTAPASPLSHFAPFWHVYPDLNP